MTPLDQRPIRRSAARRPRAWRWVVASLVSVLMLLATTGIAVVAQAGTSAVGPAFVPATAVGYGELRLDLPGDQHEQLAALMAHFPGFADQASFDTKLDGLLDQLLSSGSGGSATWTGNIKTWSNGQVALAVLGIPVDTGSSTTTAQPQVVIGLGVKDRAALETQISGLMRSYLGTPPEPYAGATITTVGNTSYAITDQYLLVSPNAADIKVSLDVLAGTIPSLASDPGFLAASASMPADNLGEFFVATAGLKPFIEQQLAQQPSGAVILSQLANLPAWVSGYAQVASDHLTIGASTQLATGGWVPAVRETDIAAHFPATTMLYVEARDLGTIVDGLLGQLKLQQAADPANTRTITGLEQGFGTTLDKTLDFVQDGALGVSFDGQRLSAGIVATLSDPVTGGSRLQTLLDLLRFAGGGPDARFSVSLPVNGVTTITLNPSSGVPAMNLPIEPALSVGVAGDHLYLGLGDFAATAIAQDPATSLAANPRYVAAVTAAGTPNAGEVWLDVATTAPLLAGILLSNPPTNPNYETDVKPWVDVLDSLVATATVNGDVASLKALLFVNK